MPAEQPTSLQDIIARRREEEFVGREEPLSRFRDNLYLPVDDPRRRFVWNVHGPAGVGKTWLLARMRQIAEAEEAYTAWSDEDHSDMPSVLGALAAQLGQQGLSLKAFEERYRTYRQQRKELEADPEAPQGLPFFLGQILARAGMRLARQVPIGGALVELVDEEQVAEQMGEWLAYLGQRLTNKDEVQLMLEPVATLTPLFLADLRKRLRKRQLVLFFDAFERTGVFLEPWLLSLLEGRFGDVPAHVIFVIGGREPLDPSRWTAYEQLIHRVRLSPFTEEELRTYLERKGITDPQAMNVVRRLTGGLPLLVATVTAGPSPEATQFTETSETAVAHFLKWAPDATARTVAVNAALPRQLNRDIFQIVAGEGADDRFEWLIQLPFVEETPHGWVYHDLVRYQLVRHKRRESPDTWRSLHERLARYYEEQQQRQRVRKGSPWDHAPWVSATLERLYHRLCAEPLATLPDALNDFMAALHHHPTLARRWAETIRQSGDDAGVEDVRRWGKRLLLALTRSGEEGHRATVEAFTALIESPHLARRWLGLAYLHRGLAHLALRDYDTALTDLSAAIRRLPRDPRPWVYRGEVHLQRGDYRKALVDFSRALENDPQHVRAWQRRAVVHLHLGRRRQALADVNRALRLRPDHAAAYVTRGEIYRLQNNLTRALADFEQALALNPDDPEALSRRGYIFLQQGRLQDAVADFNQALRLRPDNTWTLAWRGETYRLLGYYLAALSDFTRVLQQEPNNAWVLASRGELYRTMGEFEKALADLDEAVRLNPNDLWARACRGVTLIHLQRPREALKDLSYVLEKDPRDPWTLAHRAEAYRRLRQLTAALRDITRAIRLAPEEDWYYYVRALVYLSYSKRKVTKARRDLEKAIAIAERRRQSHPEDWANLLNLALYHLAQGNEATAKTLYEDALRSGATVHHVRAALDDVRTLAATVQDLLQTESIERLHEERLGAIAPSIPSSTVE